MLQKDSLPTPNSERQRRGGRMKEGEEKEKEDNDNDGDDE